MRTLRPRTFVTPLSLAAFVVATSGASAGEASLDRPWPAELPLLQELTMDADFVVFMASGVPAEIRTLALRKLWRLSAWKPDGLDNYDGDYNRPSGPEQSVIAGDDARLTPLANR